MMANSKETNYSHGVWAEGEALRYLEELGFTALRERYKTKFGEIDLIVQKGELVCFVEVKMRQSEVEALEAVTKRARKRIENSALFFLSENPEFINHDMRFDVVAIFKSGYSHDFQITHLDNAWEAGS